MSLLKTNKLKYFIFTIIIVALDLSSKDFANTHLILNQSYEITNVFNLTLLYNTGAAFSIFSNDKTSWQLIILSIISFVAIIILITIIIRQPNTNKLNLICFSMILGGTLGNFYCRVFRGFVIDFLDLHIHKYHWPIFNIADLTITCGVVILLLTTFFKKNYF